MAPLINNLFNIQSEKQKLTNLTLFKNKGITDFNVHLTGQIFLLIYSFCYKRGTKELSEQSPYFWLIGKDLRINKGRLETNSRIQLYDEYC